ncbi:hypothetical protein [Streptomyces sp. NPDC088789]|uniref:hypothetical protein n=1 Tax=Streptomyces sp. NPDC088789 TaxID=3365899 RepID=UPI0038164150
MPRLHQHQHGEQPVMGLGKFLRSLAPGNDAALAADLSQQRRRAHRREIPRVARDADRWEQTDRARDRQGDRRTDWTR